MPALGSVQFLTIHCAATPEGRHVTHQQIKEQAQAQLPAEAEEPTS